MESWGQDLTLAYGHWGGVIQGAWSSKKGPLKFVQWGEISSVHILVVSIDRPKLLYPKRDPKFWDSRYIYIYTW